MNAFQIESTPFPTPIFNRKRQREPPTNFQGKFPGYSGPVAMEIEGEEQPTEYLPIFVSFPDNKKSMKKKDPDRYTQHIPLDLSVLNHKIEEVRGLLEELYRMKEYFESKNKKEDRPCSYIC